MSGYLEVLRSTRSNDPVLRAVPREAKSEFNLALTPYPVSNM